jgi:hypothetical protein
MEKAKKSHFHFFSNFIFSFFFSSSTLPFYSSRVDGEKKISEDEMKTIQMKRGDFFS